MRSMQRTTQTNQIKGKKNVILEEQNTFFSFSSKQERTQTNHIGKKKLSYLFFCLCKKEHKPTSVKKQQRIIRKEQDTIPLFFISFMQERTQNEREPSSLPRYYLESGEIHGNGKPMMEMKFTYLACCV